MLSIAVLLYCFLFAPPPPAPDLNVAKKDVEPTLQDRLVNAHKAGTGGHQPCLLLLSVLMFGAIAGMYSNTAGMMQEWKDAPILPYQSHQIHKAA